MALKPPALLPGDTIGVVTLGSPAPPEAINTGIAFLQANGYRVVIGQNVYANTGITAGTDIQRATDLMNMFENKEVKMIMTTRGGTGSAGILPYLDYRVIRNNPKIFTGYSDMTVIVNALSQYSYLTTFLGLMVRNLSPTLPAYNWTQFLSAVQSTQTERTIETPLDSPPISLVAGNVTGRLAGGNLSTMVSTLGTRYEINTYGKILLIEDDLEPSRKIYRYIKQLLLAGKLKDCAGFVIGSCTKCEVDYAVTFEDVVRELLVPLGKPILTNMPFSHGLYNLTLPIGTLANLNTTTNTLTLLEGTVQ